MTGGGGTAELPVELAATLTTLSAQAPGVQIVVTDGQQLWAPEVDPTPAADLLTSPAVALFLRRAQAVQPLPALDRATVRIVAAICARLDGLPLALELAAGRSKQFSPAALLRQLDARLALLTGGPRDQPARHQTLRALLDWSYDLLEPADQGLLATCAVFAGGWTDDAAAALGATGRNEPPTAEVAAGLMRLVNHSLIGLDVPSSGAPRYRMLATIREYALDRLTAQGAAAETAERHVRYFRDLAVAQATHFQGAGQVAAYGCLQREYANLRQALQTAAATGARAIAGPLVVALWPFWRRQGYWSEGRAWLAVLLDQRAALPPLLSAQLEEGAGVLAFYQGDLATAEALLTRSLHAYQRLEYARGIVAVLNQLGTIARRRNDLPIARQLLTAGLAVAQQQADTLGMAETSYRLGTLAYVEDQLHAADRYFAESLRLFRGLAHTEGIARALHTVAMVGGYLAEPTAVRAALEESLALYRLLQDTDGIGRILIGLAELHRLQEDYTRATALYTESLVLMQELGARSSVALCWLNLGQVAADQGQWTRAQELYQRSLVTFQALGHQGFATETLLRLGDATWPTGALERAREWYDQALNHAQAQQMTGPLAWAWFGLGQVARGHADWAHAQVAYYHSLRYYQATDLPGATVRVLIALAAVAHAQHADAQARRLYRAVTPYMTAPTARIEPQDRAAYRQVGALLAQPDADPVGRGDEPAPAAGWADLITELLASGPPDGVAS